MDEQEARLIRLLDRVVDRDRDARRLGSAGSYDDDATDASAPTSDIDALVELGYVVQVPGLDGHRMQVTSFGRIQAAKRRAWRTDRVNRQCACRTAAVTWLHDIGAIGDESRSRPWTVFQADPDAIFVGYPFEGDDVDDAARWLQRHGLIDGQTEQGSTRPARAFLTTEGADCADNFDSDVQRYLSAQRQGRA